MGCDQPAAPGAGDDVTMTTSSGRGRVSAFTDDALGDSDVVGLLDRLRRREVSAGELVEASRRRADAVDGRLNAVVSWTTEPTPTPDSSAAAFGGIPTFIKDNEAVTGLPRCP